MIALKKEFSFSPVEFYKFQLYQLINVPIPVLNETNITVLAYVHVYKEEASYKIIKDRILTSINSCYNYFSTLKNMGYLIKEDGDKSYYLNPQMHIEDNDYLYIIKVGKDESNSTVNHPYYEES